MTIPTLLSGIWIDGLFIVGVGDIQQELEGDGSAQHDLSWRPVLRVDESGRIERTTITIVSKPGRSFVDQSEILFDLLSVDRRANDSLT